MKLRAIFISLLLLLIGPVLDSMFRPKPIPLRFISTNPHFYRDTPTRRCLGVNCWERPKDMVCFEYGTGKDGKEIWNDWACAPKPTTEAEAIALRSEE